MIDNGTRSACHYSAALSPMQEACIIAMRAYTVNPTAEGQVVLRTMAGALRELTRLSQETRLATGIRVAIVQVDEEGRTIRHSF